MPFPKVFRMATLMMLVSAAIVVTWSGLSAAATLGAPQVLSAYATPSALGPSGGTVTVTGRVKNARTCQLEVLSRQSFPVVYSHNPTSACQNGAFSARVLIGANPSPVKRTVAFALLAPNGSLSSTGLFYVIRGAVPGALGLIRLCHPERPRPERGHRDRDGQGEERPHLPARGAVAPVVPRGLLAQPDQRLPERGVLGSCADRGQPEPGQAHRGVRPLGAQREPVVHRALLRIRGPFLAPSVLSAYATPSALGPSGGTVTVTGRVKNARTCQLEVLSRQSFPVVYSHNPTSACQNGAFSARVDRGQPEPGQAHRGVRPVRARREPVVHRALLRVPGAAARQPPSSSAATSAPAAQPVHAGVNRL